MENSIKLNNNFSVQNSYIKHEFCSVGNFVSNQKTIVSSTTLPVSCSFKGYTFESGTLGSAMSCSYLNNNNYYNIQL